MVAFLHTAIKNNILVVAIVICNALKDNTSRQMYIIIKLSGAIISVPKNVSITASLIALFFFWFTFVPVVHNLTACFNIEFSIFKSGCALYIINI